MHKITHTLISTRTHYRIKMHTLTHTHCHSRTQTRTHIHTHLNFHTHTFKSTTHSHTICLSFYFLKHKTIFSYLLLLFPLSLNFIIFFCLLWGKTNLRNVKAISTSSAKIITDIISLFNPLPPPHTHICIYTHIHIRCLTGFFYLISVVNIASRISQDFSRIYAISLLRYSNFKEKYRTKDVSSYRVPFLSFLKAKIHPNQKKRQKKENISGNHNPEKSTMR